MSEVFPFSRLVRVNEALTLTVFECDDMVLQLATIEPGAVFPLHQHEEHQMGVVLSPGLEMHIHDSHRSLKPLSDVYSVGAYVPHGSVNRTNGTILAFDLKRKITLPADTVPDAVVLPLAIDRTAADNGVVRHRAVGSWFTLEIVTLMPGQSLPVCCSEQYQFGFPLADGMKLTVGAEQKTLGYGEMYHVPPEGEHTGSNQSTQTLNVLTVSLPVSAEASAILQEAA